jgi:hypothetical protein
MPRALKLNYDEYSSKTECKCCIFLVSVICQYHVTDTGDFGKEHPALGLRDDAGLPHYCDTLVAATPWECECD